MWQQSAVGCPPTASNSTWRKRSGCGRALGATSTDCQRVHGDWHWETTWSTSLMLCEFLELSIVTPDLSLDKHVTAVSSKCFFQLRQLRRVRRSLDDESVATLVHAFVTSHYCNGLLAGAPKVVTGDWQAAARNELGSACHSLQTHGSLTTVCRTSDMKSCTCWM